MHNILDDLENLVKRAGAAKADALRKAAGDTSSKLDNAEDGTSSATTGEMADDQMRAQRETYPDNAADTGAEDNKPGASVDKSTDEATAAATDGQAGAKGGLMAVKKDADNGPTLGDTPKPDGWNSGAFKQAAADMRKQAKALRERAAELRKQAEAEVHPLDRFLAKQARATDDPALKKQAEAVDDAQLAEAATAELLQQLESGEISEEEAQQILQEAMADGAVSEEDLAAVGQEAEAGYEDEEAMLGAKLAAADIGPDDPQYVDKLMKLYPAEIQTGYALAVKYAQERLQKEAQEALPDEAALAEEAAAAEAAALAEEAPVLADELGAGAEGEAVIAPEEAMMAEEALVSPEGDDEAAALQAVQEELGLDDAALAELMAAEVPQEAKIALAKTASAMKQSGIDFATRARTTILNKVAALKK